MSLLGSGARRTRKAASVATVVLAALAVTSCGSDSDSGSDSGSGSGGGEKPATSGAIDWWGWAPDVVVGQKWVDAFNEVYPDIKVTYKNFENQQYNTALRPGLSSSEGPDVFGMALGGDVGEFPTYKDYALDLLPDIKKKLGADWMDQYGASHEGLMNEGKLAGLELGGVAGGFVWVNQDLFDKYDLEVPTTYDEWVSVCDTFAENGVGCLALGAAGASGFSVETLRTIADNIEPGYWMKAIQAEESWDGPVIVEAMTIFQRMKDDGIIPKDALALQQYPEANNAFMSQQAAMVQMGTWYAQYSLQENAKVAMEGAGVANPKPFTQLPADFPDVSGKGNGPQLFGEIDYGLAVNARSDAIGAAKTFVLWLTATEEGAATVSNSLDLVPSLKVVKQDWANLDLVSPEVQRPALEELFTAAAEPTGPRNQLTTPAQLAALDFAVVSLLEGKATPQEAAAKLQSDLGE